MGAFEETADRLSTSPRSWLVTGAAGFIGSNLVQSLLELDQRVVGLDNFATGRRENLDEVEGLVGRERWSRFRFQEGDVASSEVCREALAGVDVVLHQAALGSVPRSVEDPLASNAANVTGTLALLEAARQAGVRRFVYASSSSVYGDSEQLPKVEDELGRPLSPYAVTKLGDELYADVFGRLHGLETVGLRYFNVFGPRQDPEGAYAAVIPCWIAAMIRDDEVRIHGTGETSRDFCYVRNVVQANLLAGTVLRPGSTQPGLQHCGGPPHQPERALRGPAGAAPAASPSPRGPPTRPRAVSPGRRAPLPRRHRQGPAASRLRARLLARAGARRVPRLVRTDPSVTND